MTLSQETIGMAAMARSSARSEWERQQAALRREAERRAREQVRLAKEREKALQQRYLESQQRAAEAQTAAVDLRVETLDEVLTGILALPSLSFDRLRVAPKVPSFDPGPLAIAHPAPDWNEYAPIQPGTLSRLFGGVARRERQTAGYVGQF
jgi:restriction system protein